MRFVIIFGLSNLKTCCMLLRHVKGDNKGVMTVSCSCRQFPDKFVVRDLLDL